VYESKLLCRLGSGRSLVLFKLAPLYLGKLIWLLRDWPFSLSLYRDYFRGF
jgi:hypothetical protein